jgi:hypothetical protein
MLLPRVSNLFSRPSIRRGQVPSLGHQISSGAYPSPLRCFIRQRELVAMGDAGPVYPWSLVPVKLALIWHSRTTMVACVLRRTVQRGTEKQVERHADRSMHTERHAGGEKSMCCTRILLLQNVSSQHSFLNSPGQGRSLDKYLHIFQHQLMPLLYLTSSS